MASHLAFGAIRVPSTLTHKQHVRESRTLSTPTPPLRSSPPSLHPHPPRYTHICHASTDTAPTTDPPTTSGQQQTTTATVNDTTITSLIDFLREDLQHLFDDQGIDVTKYDPEVEFEDPITKYSSLQGYLLNIQFLRRVFDPTFILHDLKQTGPYDITTRWTMRMTPTFTSVFPGPIRKMWNPVLTFTGTSIMSVNPATGKFNKHVDTWDAIDEQKFFSFEAFTHMLSQVGDLRRTPQELATPNFTVLKKLKNFEIRRYEPYTVAEAPLDFARMDEGVKSRVGPASQGFRAFNDLAGYIFGGNEKKQKMAMTTPVFSDTQGKMNFYLGPEAEAMSSLPQPNSPTVSIKREAGGVFAVSTFSGLALEGDAEAEYKKLKQAVAEAGLSVMGSDWALARYNDPGTPPPFRKNEILIPLEGFKLW